MRGFFSGSTFSSFADEELDPGVDEEEPHQDHDDLEPHQHGAGRDEEAAQDDRAEDAPEEDAVLLLRAGSRSTRR